MQRNEFLVFFLNAGSDEMERMPSGSKFQTRGPATENARSPNKVLVAGTSYFPAEAESKKRTEWQ